ncbi:hypothetical protein SPRG_10143 [Saprolegnia parasitica CBS 223.65]|uniref:FYVE-type domain-containing protein n=1 Tax=Saprolegnia parasitica (strain CBS 223.65) TaxID=695850 RepID=A0A067CDJ0_SAPPC|nr:hypothetical protein SPRG_10143 [Saprolegnia parasitica CBS 223.65]KDO24611.1 hypothetical protein SPRG_10143 [Saprolegnia parasitica CBS 223.65]|eukprot:XP_012204679.1 hypothetical protein SPRG_10143 [Saprolegnia parasitica CBS 223.65]
MTKYVADEADALRGIDVLQGVPLSGWKPDAHSDRCNACVKKFRLFRRKHHCRVCGEIYCYKCLQERYVRVPLAGTALTLACMWCVDSAPQDEALSRGVPSTQKSLFSLPRSTESEVPPPPPVVKSFPLVATHPMLSPIHGVPKLRSVQLQAPASATDSLASICASMCDAMDSTFGALVLYKDGAPLTVLTQQGLGAFVMGEAFRLLCSRAVLAGRICCVNYSSGVFQFCATAPLQDPKTHEVYGCAVVLDAYEKPGLNPALVLPHFAKLSVEKLLSMDPQLRRARPLCSSYHETHAKLISIRRIPKTTEPRLTQ